MSTKSIFDQIWDDVPFSLDTGVWHSMSCCDCGLVHKMRMTVDVTGTDEDAKNIVLFEVKVDKRGTKKQRKNFPGLVLPTKEIE